MSRNSQPPIAIHQRDPTSDGSYLAIHILLQGRPRSAHPVTHFTQKSIFFLQDESSTTTFLSALLIDVVVLFL